MKRGKLLVILLLVLVTSTQLAVAQLNVWRSQNPLVAGNAAYAIQMISLKTSYACGAGGMVVRTFDGGTRWEIKTSVAGIHSALRSLSFLNETFGMCCGDSGHVIKTTDGGNTWTLLSTASLNRFNSVVVIDTNTALVVAFGGGISKTTDGGASWKNVVLEGSEALYSIRSLRPDFIYATGFAGAILKSIDTGRSWQKIATPYGNTFYSAVFANDLEATVVGDLGFITHTSDGGVSWKRQGIFVYPGPLTATMNSVDGKGTQNISAVGSGSTIVNTSNSGTDWIFCNTQKTGDLRGVSFFDSLNGIAIGDGTALKTSDGGKTWNYAPHQPFDDNLSSVAFPKGDTLNGFAVGSAGTILHTTNGGQDWRSIPIGWNHQLRCITFVDSVTVIAVGDYGMILKSTDMGVTWYRQLSETSNNLYSISFSTRLDGLVAGDNNTIMRSYSGGSYWTYENAAPAELVADYFNCVSYPDSMHAFMTGFHGYYTSNDGGITWKYVGLDTSNLADHVCSGISFADSLHGALLLSYNDGRTQAVRFTSDGGRTWFVEHDLPSTPEFVQFVDAQHATVVGQWGYIGHSIDSGRTLVKQTSNTGSDLHGVCFSSLKAGTAVGSGGTIIRITTDEKFVSVKQQEPSGSPRIIIDGTFPNPFSGSSMLRYHLPESAFTGIEVYSMDGVNVRSLGSEFELAGDHELKFNLYGLASGTYICRVVSGGMHSEIQLKVEN